MKRTTATLTALSANNNDTLSLQRSLAIKVHFYSHVENVLQVDAVLDASFLPSFRCQVGEPDNRDPVLQVRRTNVLKHLPLLRCHETYRWGKNIV